MTSDAARRRAFRSPGPQDFDDEFSVENPFYSGEFKYAVEVGPPSIPVGTIRAFDNPLSTGFWIVFGLPILWICDLFDSRTRVSISRAKPRGVFFDVVYVEYVPGMQAAMARQIEIRNSWVHGKWDSMPRLTRKEMRLKRLATKSEEPNTQVEAETD